MADPHLAELVRRAQRRDAAALEALVDLYGGRVFGYLFRVLAARDEAEDLTQEVFLRVTRMIGQYQDDGRFENWLFRIASNLVRDRGRRRGRTPARIAPRPSDGPIGDPMDEFPGDDERPDRPIELSEDVDRLTAALAELPAAEREVIMLRHFSDMSFKEIADAMGTPLGTALARGHRGLRRLRELMEPAPRTEPLAAEVEP